MTKIRVEQRILNANDQLAAVNRKRLDAADVFSLNLMASPGAGKTSLIERMMPGLKHDLRVGVVDGDIATSIDAERAMQAGAVAVQINTGGQCHLDAVLLKQGLDRLPLKDIDLLLVENVGNLVCPVNFQLGTHVNVLIASVPEGDDKPYKYPGMYRGIDVLLINKIDLLPYIPFRMDYFRRGVEILNPGLTIFPVSCHTGEGLADWMTWVQRRLAAGVGIGVHE